MTGPEHEPVEVVLVEDHPTFRFGLRARLEREPDIVVVGEAATGQEATSIVEETAPDVIIVDLILPDVSGVELIRQLTAISPQSAILVLTMLDDESVFTALRAGARGYLLKDTQPARIVAAIHAVSIGEVVLSPSVAVRVLAVVTDQQANRPVTFAGLSPREHDILELIAAGRDNAEIGRRLGLRPKTVRNYVSNVLTKLQVADRDEAMLRARDAGLG